MMFVAFYTPAQPPTGMPDPEHMAKMGAMMEDMTKRGILVASHAFLRSPNNACLQLAKGTYTATDTPAGAGKENGFAILRAGSKAEVIEHVKVFLAVAGDGECEIRELMTGPPPG